ncbi:hypothetical protein EBB59_11920 [Lysobacter pythonis]|uniref:Cell envelope integrity protein TolA n=1 Tax=Solilutibacter pythonis TaxID=2483112 RepID=A0A3M2HF58_9GAMM|nr:hypothetical protein [Lysobacter pythonis]RMH88371.1 hypothetical protein EBB59_11920 [Lysobacter pythonis]
MRIRNTVLWLAAAGAFALFAGNALAQQKQGDEPKQGSEQPPADQKAEEKKRAEAEAAKQRRAERRAARTGDEREKEEDEPLN